MSLRPVGSTSNLATIRIFDDGGVPAPGLSLHSNGAVINYKRQGSAAVTITITGSPTPNYTDVGDGSYEIAVPDAAYASANPRLTIEGTLAGHVIIPDVQQVGAPAVTTVANSDKAGYSLTTGERGSIADAVWDEDNRDHLSAHSTGLVVYALSTMLEFVSSIWRWKSTALSQAPSGGGGEGDYAITLVATSTGGAVPATKFSIVGTSTVVYANSLGVAVVNLDADTYTLRTTPPPGYQPVADSPLVVAADATVTKTLVAIPAPTPPSPSQCLLSVYVAKQSGSPFESVTVTARFPAGWSVASGTMAVNAVIEDVTDSTGLAQLMLYREQEYDLSFARQNGTIAKIRITTPNAASASLSQVYSP